MEKDRRQSTAISNAMERGMMGAKADPPQTRFRRSGVGPAAFGLRLGQPIDTRQARPRSSHYGSATWSAPLDTLVLQQPLLLPPPPSSSGPAHLRSPSSNSNAAPPAERDVQMEVGVDRTWLRTVGVRSGQWVELKSAVGVDAASGTTSPRRVLALLQGVDMADQAVHVKQAEAASEDGNTSALVPVTPGAAAPAAAAAAAPSSAGIQPVLLLPPGMHWHLFASAAPLPSSPLLADADAVSSMPKVCLRLFQPPVLSAPLPGEFVHTINHALEPHVYTASAVTVARIATPASSTRAYSSCEAQLSATFTRVSRDQFGGKVLQPRRRIMFAGSDTILAVPALVHSAAARHSWLMKPPLVSLDGSVTQPSAAAFGEDDEQGEEDAGGLDDASADNPGDDASGHLLPTGVMRLLYFRITRVEPAPFALSSHYFLIDPERTALMQEGVEHARVPYELEYFLSNHQYDLQQQLQRAPIRRYIEPLPSPLAQMHTLMGSFKQLRALFLPSLLSSFTPMVGVSSSSSGLSAASALLSGPRRSCKRLLASAVACSLGVHYLEANMFTLLSSGQGDGLAGEQTVQNNLARLFARARANAPCVLHLRRLGALKSWAQALQKDKEVLVTNKLSELMQAASAGPDSSSSASRQSATNVLHPSGAPLPVLVLGSCESLGSLPVPLRNLFLHALSLTPPSLDERKQIVRAVLHAPPGAAADEEAGDAAEDDAAVPLPRKHSRLGEETPALSEAQEIRAAAVEVADISKRSLLTSSPSPSPPPAPATSVSKGLSPGALASLVAQKTAGMNSGELVHFVASVAKVATERVMQQREEQEKEIIAAAKKAADADKARRATNGDADTQERKYDSPDESSSSVSAAFAAFQALASAPVAPVVTAADLERAVSLYAARSAAQAGTLATLPNVKWADVGGLEQVKREVMEAIELPLKFPHLFANGVKKRAGLLLYGPPGTGKTMIAKAVATECHLNFMSVKGPELLNQYVGESERNVRAVFQRARHAKPVVVFFDELDALAPARGQGSDGGGVMDRVVSALLAELDSGAANDGVFIVAATNRPDLIEAGLLRPGRLDRCVYLGVSETREQQHNILRALTRKFHLAPEVDLEQVVNKCTFTMSGADFYALASDALLQAIKRKIALLEERLAQAQEEQRAKKEGKAKQKEEEKKDGESAALVPAAASAYRASGASSLDDDNDEEDSPITAATLLSSLSPAELLVSVSQEDFLQAQAALKPSLDEEQLRHYQQLQAKFSQNHAGGKGHADSSSKPEEKQPLPQEEKKKPEQQRVLTKKKPWEIAAAAEGGAGGSSDRALATAPEARRRQQLQDPSQPAASSSSTFGAASSSSSSSSSASFSSGPLLPLNPPVVPSVAPAASASSGPSGAQFNMRNEWERSGLRQRMAAAAAAANDSQPTRMGPTSFSAYASTPSADGAAAGNGMSSYASRAGSVLSSSAGGSGYSGASSSAAASGPPLKPWQRAAAATAASSAPAVTSGPSSASDSFGSSSLGSDAAPAATAASSAPDTGVPASAAEISDSAPSVTSINGAPAQSTPVAMAAAAAEEAAPEVAASSSTADAAGNGTTKLLSEVVAIGATEQSVPAQTNSKEENEAAAAGPVSTETAPKLAAADKEGARTAAVADAEAGAAVVAAAGVAVEPEQPDADVDADGEASRPGIDTPACPSVAATGDANGAAANGSHGTPRKHKPHGKRAHKKG